MKKKTFRKLPREIAEVGAHLDHAQKEARARARTERTVESREAAIVAARAWEAWVAEYVHIPVSTVPASRAGQRQAAERKALHEERVREHAARRFHR